MRLTVNPGQVVRYPFLIALIRVDTTGEPRQAW